MDDPLAAPLGHPRLHLRRTDSTNERARALAIAGAPHGTLVSASEQTAGRGRQGRSWIAPAGNALLCSLVLRWGSSDRPPTLLSLIAGVALCDAIAARTLLKWPNDVVVESPDSDPRSGAVQETGLAKLAGILVEGRPQEGWAVLGIGLNVAVHIEELPPELRKRAASLGLPQSAIEPIMDRLLQALSRRLAEPTDMVLGEWRARDALLGREISWTHGAGDSIRYGRAEGIDDRGRLLVRCNDATTVLDAGEVHLSGG